MGCNCHKNVKSTNDYKPTTQPRRERQNLVRTSRIGARVVRRTLQRY